MRILYRINQVVFIITVLLYLTIYLGLVSQIVLGGVQVISACILLLYWSKLPEKAKNKLSIYWIIIAIYGLITLLTLKSFDEYFVFTFMIIPMSIASYFFHILNSIKNTQQL